MSAIVYPYEEFVESTDDRADRSATAFVSLTPAQRGVLAIVIARRRLRRLRHIRRRN